MPRRHSVLVAGTDDSISKCEFLRNGKSPVTEEVFLKTKETTDGNAAALASFSIPADTICHFECKIWARRTGGTSVLGAVGGGASYKAHVTYKNIAGAISQVGRETLAHIAEDVALFDVLFAVVGTSVEIRVKGVANANVTWHGMITVNCVKD